MGVGWWSVPEMANSGSGNTLLLILFNSGRKRMLMLEHPPCAALPCPPMAERVVTWMAREAGVHGADGWAWEWVTPSAWDTGSSPTPPPPSGSYQPPCPLLLEP